MNPALDKYLASQPPHTDQHWADHFGISRVYWNQIKNGVRPVPSKEVIKRMADRTGGGVPVESWFEAVEDRGGAQ